MYDGTTSSTDPPVCRLGQKVTYTGTVGETLGILCDVDAVPGDVAFQWKRQPRDIYDGGGGVNNGGSHRYGSNNFLSNSVISPKSTINKKQQDSDSDLVFTTKQTVSTLVVTPADRSDFTTYSCRARNSVGWQKEPCYFTLVPSG